MAAAQVRIANLLPGLKYAYIVDGPLWRRKEMPEDWGLFELMIKGLVEEYVKKRGYSLKIYPFIHDGDSLSGRIRNSLLGSGFINSKERPRTLLLDMSLSMEDLKKNLRKNWRQCLG